MAAMTQAGAVSLAIVLTFACSLVTGAALVLAARRSQQKPVARRRREVAADVFGRAAAEVLVVVDAHESGLDDPLRTGREVVAILQEFGAAASGAVTRNELGLTWALRVAAESGSRVALVGGDSCLYAAANAPLNGLPELAIVPVGRTNTIARALQIPTDRVEAALVAAYATAVDLVLPVGDRFGTAAASVSVAVGHLRVAAPAPPTSAP